MSELGATRDPGHRPERSPGFRVRQLGLHVAREEIEVGGRVKRENRGAGCRGSGNVFAVVKEVHPLPFVVYQNDGNEVALGARPEGRFSDAGNENFTIPSVDYGPTLREFRFALGGEGDDLPRTRRPGSGPSSRQARCCRRTRSRQGNQEESGSYAAKTLGGSQCRLAPNDSDDLNRIAFEYTAFPPARPQSTDRMLGFRAQVYAPPDFNPWGGDET